MNKTSITSADLIKELRSIARQLTSAAKSDTLDHTRVCTDTAQSIRDWLKTVELAKPRVLVVMEGGLVQHLLSDVEIAAHVVDYDTDGADPAETHAIPQGDGETTDGFLLRPGSEIAPERITEIIEAKPTLPKE